MIGSWPRSPKTSRLAHAKTSSPTDCFNDSRTGVLYQNGRVERVCSGAKTAPSHDHGCARVAHWFRRVDRYNWFGFGTGRPVKDRPKTCELWLISGNPASPPYPHRRAPCASQNTQDFGRRGQTRRTGLSSKTLKPASPRRSALTVFTGCACDHKAAGRIRLSAGEVLAQCRLRRHSSNFELCSH